MFQLPWTRKRNLPPAIPADYIPNTRDYSPEEIAQLQKKKVKEAEIVSREQITKHKSVLQLAKITICGFFGIFSLLSFSILLCDIYNVKADNTKWAMDKFLSSTSPFVAAVVFYYFGKASEDKKLS